MCVVIINFVAFVFESINSSALTFFIFSLFHFFIEIIFNFHITFSVDPALNIYFPTYEIFSLRIFFFLRNIYFSLKNTTNILVKPDLVMIKNYFRFFYLWKNLSLLHSKCKAPRRLNSIFGCIFSFSTPHTHATSFACKVFLQN